jgi:hypothetical protein
VSFDWRDFIPKPSPHALAHKVVVRHDDKLWCLIDIKGNRYQWHEVQIKSVEEQRHYIRVQPEKKLASNGMLKGDLLEYPSRVKPNKFRSDCND